MEHIVLLWREVRELEMRQMVEEINLGFLTVEQAMVKYKVLTRKTVLNWLEKVKDEEQMKKVKNKKILMNPKTVVGKISLYADGLAARVEELKQELQDAEMKALYYESVVRVAEKELGILIEKKPTRRGQVPSHPAGTVRLMQVNYPHVKIRRINGLLAVPLGVLRDRLIISIGGVLPKEPREIKKFFNW